MKPFTKLFSSIISSSIWNEKDTVRLVWITMLAMADRDGLVLASTGGLAHQARVSHEACAAALETLSGPDGDSRSQEQEGRRIAKVDGGWHVLNYLKYRELGRNEDRREYFREHKRKQRAGTVHQKSTMSTKCPAKSPIAEAEAEAEVLTAGAPLWTNSLKWLSDAKTNGADYKESECKSAWLALNANGWMWGRNPITDWRSALERQIQTDRERKNHGSKTDKPNPRNAGVYRGVTDYGEAARRKAAGTASDSKKVAG